VIAVHAPIALLFIALAAPRIPYGGNALAYVWGTQLDVDPREGSSFSDVTIAGSVYEPLYAIDSGGELVPVLAREAPRLEGNQLIVPLKDDVVFHDGRPMTPELVARWLRGLADESTRASYVVLPVKGAREALAADPRAEVRIDPRPELGAVVFTLAEPYPDYARLLASPQAAIVSPTASSGMPGPGTGPWRIAGRAPQAPDQITLEPFLGHRDGRPFLDSLVLRESSSRFGAVTEMKKGEAAVVFAPPDLRSTKRHEIIPWTKGSYPDEIVVLSIGRQIEALRTPEAHRAISAALNRGVLARRLLGQGAEPASTLLGEDRKEEAPAQPPGRARIDATLLVSKDDRVLHRIAERVQLDLLRAGVTVVIDRIPPNVLDARRRDRRYDLLLGVSYPAWPGGARPIDRFHALLSMIAWASPPSSAITSSEYAAFVRASDPDKAALLVDLERALRTRTGLVPIAARRPSLAVRTDLKSTQLRSFGRLDLSGAFFAASGRGSGP
jgi:ABC-type oligopeptide transport system substrate-binding subunit